MADPKEVCLDYALRVALLQDALDAARRRAQAAAAEASSVSANRPQDVASVFSLDLGALFGRDSAKSPRYPEKFIKILDGSLQKIAMAQDPKYSDQRFRQSIAMFWSNTWAEKHFQRQLKETRKLEELILPFVTAATRAIKKNQDDPGWMDELNSQILMFLDLLSDNLANVGSTAPELRSRLKTYRTRLQPDNRETTTRPLSTPRPPSIISADASATHGDQPSPTTIAFMEAIQALSELDEAAFIEHREKLRPTCTVEAALDDLKMLLQRLNMDHPLSYGPSDFETDAQWQAYRTRELTTLSDQTEQTLKAGPVRDRSGERSEMADTTQSFDGLGLDSRTMTFVPPNPRETYRSLLRICLAFDLQILRTLPEDQDVSLSILSSKHVTLLEECALRWRVPQVFRSWVFLDAIQEHYEHGEVPPDCVFEAMGAVGRASQDVPVADWAISDRHGLQAVLLRCNEFFLSDIEIALGAEGGYMSKEFRQAVGLWGNLDVEDDDHPSLERTQRSICDRIRQQAYANYIEEASEKYSQEGGKNRTFAMSLADWIERSAKRLDKWFPDPISSQVDVVSLVVQQHLSLWIRDLEEAMSSGAARTGEGEASNDLKEALDIYQQARKLQQMGIVYGMETSQLTLSTIFEPIVSAWLDETELKMRQWADNALKLDDFTPVGPNGPSSSVSDLFDSFHSAITFILKLEWDDSRQLATFATRLAKIISLSINDYCTKLERLFAEEMQQMQQETQQSTAKQQAWIEKAKSTIANFQGDRKIEAFFNFTAASCVKLNNIDTARLKLDQVYKDMRVDEFADWDVDKPVSTPASHLFTIKIVHGEGLVKEDGSRAPDCFATLSDERGKRHAKTRTIHEDYEPRWDETFDIAIREPAWFMVTVRNRSLTGKHDVIGRGYLRLDPGQYVEVISKDVLQPLNPRGHVLLRVSMEGERDDIQFHFGRAFRWLKRTESDMVRLFVDKMTPVLRQWLSEATLKSVVKPNSGAIDYNDVLRRNANDAFGRVASFARGAISGVQGDYTIPLPPSEGQAARPTGVQKRGPTEVEIESAIDPLFEYLETNNHTLAVTLSSDALQMVMAKLWKQILTTIEALIIPPLSDKPSNMRTLSDSELHVALRWLKFLRDFFFADGNGVPLSTLHNAKYNEITSIPIYYDMSTDELMEVCIQRFQDTLKNKAMKPSKSIIGQRNLGTIKARKTAKRSTKGENHAELIMKILRMREGTQEFLAQQIESLNAVKLADGGGGKNRKSRRGAR